MNQTKKTLIVTGAAILIVGGVLAYKVVQKRKAENKGLTLEQQKQFNVFQEKIYEVQRAHNQNPLKNQWKDYARTNGVAAFKNLIFETTKQRTGLSPVGNWQNYDYASIEFWLPEGQKDNSPIVSIIGGVAGAALGGAAGAPLGSIASNGLYNAVDDIFNGGGFTFGGITGDGGLLSDIFGG